jgi:peptidoglycan glycosyltransferase
MTAVAGIDSGKYTPSSTVDGRSPVTISGVPLNNDNNQQFGTIDLTTALTFSVNTVWGQVAESLGRSTMTDYMKRFGFYSKPPLDYPPDELNTSRVWGTNHGRRAPVPPSQQDIGRVGIGQGGLLVTPLQMAMVAAAVANGGKLMVPHLTDRVVDAYGRTVQTIKPTLYSQVMKASTAQAVGQMMTKVVNEGTGTAGALNGITVAGKTGTAQVGTTGSNLTQPWFIAFAPVDSPTVAIAVTVEKNQGGFGGTVAAPMAKAVLESLLHGQGH